MEVINSGATQNDPMQLYRDWFGMLNRGHMLTPIGASDSHTVLTYICRAGVRTLYVRTGIPPIPAGSISPAMPLRKPA